jgi:magnesium transporter
MEARCALAAAGADPHTQLLDRPAAEVTMQRERSKSHRIIVPDPPIEDAPSGAKGGAQSGVKIVATRGETFLEDVAVADLAALLQDASVNLWVDTWGIDNPEAERLAREVFRFHPLAVTDCFGAREHPKIEVFEKYLFVITHGIAIGSTAVATDTIELDVFVGPRFLYTYHERPSRSVAGALDLVMRNNGGSLRRGPAAMLHTVLDRQVDTMEPLLDDLEERISGLEDRVLLKPGSSDLTALLALKRTTLQLRRWMTRQREVVLRLGRNEFALIPQQDAILFRDIYDHLFRMTDLLDTHREMLASLHETYLSVTNLRLGEIMKFLTLFTAILMPLTVITGVYGMNFDEMPEIHSRWGYPGTLALMAVVAGGVVWFFRRRGWIGK